MMRENKSSLMILHKIIATCTFNTETDKFTILHIQVPETEYKPCMFITEIGFIIAV